jgi:3-oxoacyl-[acyl-carrier-protein] synthase II
LRRVAVTGMGVVSPVGTGKSSFFDALLSGKSGISPVDIPHHERLKVRVAGQIKDFVPDVEKKRLGQLDRFSQFALAAAREAWSEAGISEFNAESSGVYFGTSIGGAGTLEAGYANLFQKNINRVHPLSVVAAMPNAAAANIALDYGLTGPCLTYSVACASSSVAIGEACRAIQCGAITIALAGGAEALLTFGVMKSWEALMALAPGDAEHPETSCRPFAHDRTGLVLGEGAGALVLEDMEHAKKRGARIVAEVAGYGLSNDAMHLSRPEASGQIRAICAALADAAKYGISPVDVAYINAHGTATTAGDKTETEAIKAAFGTAAAGIPVSSTKALHAHMMGAAGAVEFIAAIMAMNQATAPPTMHLWKPDPECDLDYVPLVPRVLHQPRAVMSNSFAFGGTNAVLIARHC